MGPLLRQFAKASSGATAIEYGLIAALMVLVVVGGMTATGTSIGDIYNVTLGLVVAALVP